MGQPFQIDEGDNTWQFALSSSPADFTAMRITDQGLEEARGSWVNPHHENKKAAARRASCWEQRCGVADIETGWF